MGVVLSLDHPAMLDAVVWVVQAPAGESYCKPHAKIFTTMSPCPAQTPAAPGHARSGTCATAAVGKHHTGLRAEAALGRDGEDSN